eukprot:scaffold22459_cov54-Attheya_sp.AAC.4
MSPRTLQKRPTYRLHCTKKANEKEKIYIWSFLAYHSNDDCAASIGLIRHLIITASPQIHRRHLTALPSLETPPRTLQKRPTSRLHCMNNENENEKNTFRVFLRTTPTTIVKLLVV